MDELHKIAAEYFNEFEGRHLYPKFWTLWPLCMIASIFANVAFFVFGRNTYATSDLITIVLAASGVGCYLKLRSWAEEKLRLEFGSDLKAARLRRLEEITGQPRTEFAKLAQEAIDLIALKDAISPRPFNAMKWVYRRDFSTQLVALSVSLVALIISISPSSFTLEPDALFMLIESRGLWNLAVIVLFIIGVLYAFGMGLAFVLSEVSAWFPRFRAMWTPLNEHSPARLNYLVRHLVRYHHFAAEPRQFAL